MVLDVGTQVVCNWSDRVKPTFLPLEWVRLVTLDFLFQLEDFLFKDFLFLTQALTFSACEMVLIDDLKKKSESQEQLKIRRKRFANLEDEFITLFLLLSFQRKGKVGIEYA